LWRAPREVDPPPPQVGVPQRPVRGSP
jgi:hypothetical protein